MTLPDAILSAKRSVRNVCRRDAGKVKSLLNNVVSVGVDERREAAILANEALADVIISRQAKTTPATAERTRGASPRPRAAARSRHS
jgi:hypothetical protein